MKVLIYDFMQESNAPSTLKSPSLADKFTGTSVEITLDEERTFNCVGIGNTDATVVTIAGQTINLTDPTPMPDSYKNGLYIIPSTTETTFTISHNGSYLGRCGIGLSRSIYASPSREPGFWTTKSNRITLSANIIEGAGGVSGRRLDLDFRYKIDTDFFTDIELAYQDQLSSNFPLFLYFDKETHRMPWERLYASTDYEPLFQSAVNRFLYSKRYQFQERY